MKSTISPEVRFECVQASVLHWGQKGGGGTGRGNVIQEQDETANVEGWKERQIKKKNVKNKQMT